MSKEIGCGQTFLYIFFSALMIFVIFASITKPKYEKEVIETVEYFNGTLGMAVYSNSWFGLGGIDKTELSFDNGSDIVSFVFNQNLAVTIGRNYTIKYNITQVNFYYSEPIIQPVITPFGLEQNFTRIEMLGIIEK